MTTTMRASRELPYHVLRAIRRYRGEFQAEITRAMAEKMAMTGGAIKPEDVGACAADIIFGKDDCVRREKKAMENMSIRAYHLKDFKYLDDKIAALTDELSRCSS